MGLHGIPPNYGRKKLTPWVRRPEEKQEDDMPHNHFIKKCSCGKVISQCRCMAKDKQVLLEENGCAECRAKIKKAGASGSNSTKLLCCEHRRTRQMVWPDNGSAEVCTDCLLTRHHWEQGETEWQNHNYKTVADWYQEAADLQRSMDKMWTI